MKTKLIIAVATVVGSLAAGTAWAQTPPPSPTADLGKESANWGLTPFSAVPTVALRPEDRAAVRTLEDQQIKERRTFEDKYEAELRALIQKHADEREALRVRLSPQR